MERLEREYAASAAAAEYTLDAGRDYTQGRIVRGTMAATSSLEDDLLDVDAVDSYQLDNQRDRRAQVDREYAAQAAAQSSRPPTHRERRPLNAI